MLTLHKSNIFKDERKALNDLKNYDSIIIKQADKEGTTIIMDSQFIRKRSTNYCPTWRTM